MPDRQDNNKNVGESLSESNSHTPTPVPAFATNTRVIPRKTNVLLSAMARNESDQSGQDGGSGGGNNGGGVSSFTASEQSPIVDRGDVLGAEVEEATGQIEGGFIETYVIDAQENEMSDRGGGESQVGNVLLPQQQPPRTSRTDAEPGVTMPAPRSMSPSASSGGLSPVAPAVRKVVGAPRPYESKVLDAPSDVRTGTLFPEPAFLPASGAGNFRNELVWREVLPLDLTKLAEERVHADDADADEELRDLSVRIPQYLSDWVDEFVYKHKAASRRKREITKQRLIVECLLRMLCSSEMPER